MLKGVCSEGSEAIAIVKSLDAVDLFRLEPGEVEVSVSEGLKLLRLLIASCCL